MDLRCWKEHGLKQITSTPLFIAARFTAVVEPVPASSNWMDEPNVVTHTIKDHSAFQRNTNSDTRHNTGDSWKQYATWEKQTRRNKYRLILLIWAPYKANSSKQKVEWRCLQLGDGDGEKLLCNCSGVSVWDESMLEIESDDGCPNVVNVLSAIELYRIQCFKWCFVLWWF